MFENYRRVIANVSKVCLYRPVETVGGGRELEGSSDATPLNPPVRPPPPDNCHGSSVQHWHDTTDDGAPLSGNY